MRLSCCNSIFINHCESEKECEIIFEKLKKLEVLGVQNFKPFNIVEKFVLEGRFPKQLILPKISTSFHWLLPNTAENNIENKVIDFTKITSFQTDFYDSGKKITIIRAQDTLVSNIMMRFKNKKIFYNNTELDPTKTLEELGIGRDDILELRKK